MSELMRRRGHQHMPRLSNLSARVHATGPDCVLTSAGLRLAVLVLVWWACAAPVTAEPRAGALWRLLQGEVAGKEDAAPCEADRDCPPVVLAAPETMAASAGAALGVVVGVLLMLGVLVGTGYYYYKKDPEKFFNKYRNIFSRFKRERAPSEATHPGYLESQVSPPPQVPVGATRPRPQLVPVPAAMQGRNQMAASSTWQVPEAGHSSGFSGGPYPSPDTWRPVAPPRVVPPVTVQGTFPDSNYSSSNRDAHTQGIAAPPQPSLPSQQPAPRWPQPYPGSLADPWQGSATTDARPLSNFGGSAVVDHPPSSFGGATVDEPRVPVRRPVQEPAPRMGDPDTGAPQQFHTLNYDIRVRPSDGSATLGSGAYGSVEAGVFTDENGRHVQVAIKYGTGLFATKKPSEVAEVFKQELDVMSRVPVHPNIVLCYGGRVNFKPGEHIGERDVYIVEELMHSNLHEVIHGDEFQGRMPFSLILKYALDIASGLEHLHRASVMHYDLKPANILVDNELRNVKIADFGISKVKAFSYITGTLRGTIGYMAPEVLLSHFMKNLVNEKIDVYSMGVVLWEMVEGKGPSDPMSFGNESLGGTNTAVSIEEDRFPITRPCPEPLKRLIDECVSLESGNRPTAREAHQRLRDMISANRNWTGSSPGVDG
eukprot:evm.model.scf_263.2 EVM.evm.TU.scf_263.2   scf_263:32036-36797(+)